MYTLGAETVYSEKLGYVGAGCECPLADYMLKSYMNIIYEHAKVC